MQECIAALVAFCKAADGEGEGGGAGAGCIKKQQLSARDTDKTVRTGRIRLTAQRTSQARERFPYQTPVTAKFH